MAHLSNMIFIPTTQCIFYVYFFSICIYILISFHTRSRYTLTTRSHVDILYVIIWVHIKQKRRKKSNKKHYMKRQNTQIHLYKYKI